MRFIVNSSTISGNIIPPPSKSHTLRAILFALMGEGKTTIYNYLQSPDSDAMLNAIKLLGAKVEIFPNRLEIKGVGTRLVGADNVIDAGNSGQVLRFVGALAALIPTYTIITGDSSIRYHRSVAPLLSALSQLGVFAKSSRLNGYAPIIIKGPLCAKRAKLEGYDSQPVSGLIIASAFSTHPIELHVSHPGEKSWIDLTLHWLDFLGIRYLNDHYMRYLIYGKSYYSGFSYIVPADFSSLAFPLAAALITHSTISIQNIDMNDVQGDKQLLYVLCEMGAKLSIKNETIYMKRGGVLYGKKLDINDYIDAITILAVIGCYAEGTTEIYNAEIARKKECDRIYVITNELRKMGANIKETKDGLIVRCSKLHGADLESHKDHRIAMSLAVAALGAEGETRINDVGCIQKTYPTFAIDMQRLGANIKVIS